MDLIEILKAIFLGIVEGITEWLPISSTGHMLLVDEFLTLNMSDSFKEMVFIGGRGVFLEKDDSHPTGGPLQAAD